MSDPFSNQKIQLPPGVQDVPILGQTQQAASGINLDGIQYDYWTMRTMQDADKWEFVLKVLMGMQGVRYGRAPMPPEMAEMIEEQVQQTVEAARQAGQDPNEQEIDALRRLVRGEITSAEAMAQMSENANADV